MNCICAFQIIIVVEEVKGGNMMKRQRNIIVVFIIAMFCAVSLAPVHVMAVVDFTDDFNDGNYDGWTVVNGTWSASNNYLKSTNSSEISGIYFENKAIFGNFSFDVFMNSSVSINIPYSYGVYFSADDGYFTNAGIRAPYAGHCLVVSDSSFELWRFVGASGVEIGNYDHGSNFDGWYSIRVTLMSNYTVKMWIDNVLEVEGLSVHAFSNMTRFYIVAPENGAVDNIVVDGEEIVTTTTSTPTTTNSTTARTTETTPGPSPTSSSEPNTTSETSTTSESIPPTTDNGTMIILLVGVGGAIVVIIAIVLVLKRR